MWGHKKIFIPCLKKWQSVQFPINTLENPAMRRSIHQVMHRTWGRKKFPLVCILPKREIRPFSRIGCLPQLTKRAAGVKNIFWSVLIFSSGEKLPFWVFWHGSGHAGKNLSFYLPCQTRHFCRKVVVRAYERYLFSPCTALVIWAVPLDSTIVSFSYLFDTRCLKFPSHPTVALSVTRRKGFRAFIKSSRVRSCMKKNPVSE